MRNIYVWPDYSWCDIRDYPEYSWRSDDWCFVAVPDDRAEDVDNFLDETRPQDSPQQADRKRRVQMNNAIHDVFGGEE